MDFSKYRKNVANCDTCEFYSYDEDLDAHVCSVRLDEDEMSNFLCGRTGQCHYYRYYDEYASVHRQI